MAITDAHAPFAGAPDGPYLDGFAVTPTDSVDLAQLTTALYIGGAGTLRIITQKGTTLNFAAVPAGTTIRIRAKQVHSTGTSATSIVGLV